MAKARDPRAIEAYRLHDNGRGQPVPRIAEKLGVPVPTVKSWIRRIRKEGRKEADAARKETLLERGHKKKDAHPRRPMKNASAKGQDAHPAEPHPNKAGKKTPKQSHEVAKCGAHAKQSGRPCRQPAGFGTNHLGTGRCKFHGGCAGAPAGNTNAVVTGQYEKLLREALPEDERDAFDSALSEVDKKAKLQKQIALTETRILRMQKRLAYYQEQEAASQDGLEHYGTDLGEDSGNENRDGTEKGEDTNLTVVKRSKSVTVKQRKWADRILRTELALNQTQKLLKELVAELDSLENPGKNKPGGVNVQVGITWIEQAKEAAVSRPAVTMDSRRF